MPGAELADVAGAEQELVAGDFGVCRSFAEGGNEELGPTMHRRWRACFPVRGSGRTAMKDRVHIKWRGL